MAIELTHPAVDAVLSTAAALLGMEVVFVGGLHEDTFTFERVRGEWPRLHEGDTYPRSDSFCTRMLAGAPAATTDAAHDPAYRDAAARLPLGVTSYVGVPVRGPTGRVLATLCGIDRGSVPVDETTVQILRRLADVLAAHLRSTPPAAVLIRRTPAGWEVHGEPTDDLTSAMVLADLLAGELRPGARPTRPPGRLDEIDQLRLSVTQLEHALAARVVVEQAIGVLTERQHSAPREAFERLRRAARARGRRVHDLAGEVVASAAEPGTPLPPELAGPR